MADPYNSRLALRQMARYAAGYHNIACFGINVQLSLKIHDWPPV